MLPLPARARLGVGCRSAAAIGPQLLPRTFMAKPRSLVLFIEGHNLDGLEAATEYGLSRLLAKYWGPLLTGVNTQDNSKVVVTDFLLPTLTPGADAMCGTRGLHAMILAHTKGCACASRTMISRCLP